MKKTMKKALSIALAVIMAVNIFPFGGTTAIASPGPADGQVEYAGGSNSATGAYEIEVSKTIEAVSGKENLFDITLKTTTKRHIVDMSTDVVVVLDISNTMNYDSSGNETGTDANKKITFAKNATKTFVNAFCNDTNLDENRKISIVTFNRDANVAVPLTEANDLADYTGISNKIDSITAPSGDAIKWTNIEGGLRLAENILASSDAKFKYIILLTDGFPTTYLKNPNTSSVGTLEGYDPRMSGSYDASKINQEGYFANTRTNQLCTGGTSYSNRAAEKAAAAAAEIKNSGIGIFSVGVALASQDIDAFFTYIVDTTGMSAGEAFAIGTNEASYKNWLENTISGGELLAGTSGVRYTDAYNQAQLETDYGIILDTIELAPKTTMRTFYTVDPMSGVADFIGFFNKNGNLVSGNLSGESKQNAENTATYTAADETINWDMMKSGYTMSGENLVFTLKYRIRLENESAGFAFSTAYDANNPTTLHYSQQYEDGTPVPDGTGSLAYPIPEIEGYKGSLSFRKVDDSGNPLSGVKFTLQHYAGTSCSVCGGKAHIADRVVSSDAEGYVTIDNIPSGHEYVLIEEIPEGYAPIHNHNIIVSYGRTYLGTLTDENEIVDGKRNGGTGEEFLVVNSKIQSPEVRFSVKKAVENLGALSGGEYSFILNGKGINGVEYHEVRTNDAEGNVSFGKMIFDIPGTYNYTIKEVAGTDGRIVYDGTEYKIRVEVTANTEQNVTTAKIYVNESLIGTYAGDPDEDVQTVSITGAEASFTNSRRTGTKVSFSAVKEYTGTLSAGMFSFVLRDDSGNEIETAENAADGTVSFSEIEYTEPGTYKYTVEEVIGSDKSVSYDDSVYTVTVKVTPPADLTSSEGLSASVSFAAEDGKTVEKMTFSNKDKTLPSLSISGIKKVNGINAPKDRFTFVAEELEVSAVITGTPGNEIVTYTYSTIPGTDAEFRNGEAGLIAMSDHFNAEIGEIVAEINSKTGYGAGRYYRISEKAGTEEGMVYDEKAYILWLGIETTPTGESYLMDIIIHDEEAGAAIYSRTGAAYVEITGDEIFFENHEELGLVIPVKKTLDSANPAAATEEYKFILEDAHGKIGEIGITGEGTASFDPITFTAAETGTYKYIVYEETGMTEGLFYDDTVFTLEVTVSLDAEGKLSISDPVITDEKDAPRAEISFHNKDIDPEHLHIHAVKTVNGGMPTAAQRFSFELVYVDSLGNETVIGTAHNVHGAITFGEISFSAIGEYKYLVRETLPADEDPAKPGIQKEGFTYDETVHTIEVKVTDDDTDGNLEKEVRINGTVSSAEHNTVTAGGFDNTYETKPVSVPVGGTKTLSGKTLEAGQFSFRITAPAGNPLPAETEVFAAADGSFSFGEITFDKTGTYLYNVSEVIPADAVDNKKEGILYDDTVYSFAVRVTDNGKGKLEAKITVNGDPEGTLSFSNAYETDPTHVRFSAEKTLSGKELQNGMFSFRLVEVDLAGNEIPGTELVAQNGTAFASGRVVFRDILYTEPGEHRYRITEVAGTLGGITYDDTVYEVTVTVTDNGAGSLEAFVDGVKTNSHNAGTFANSYNAEPVAVNPEVRKNLSGREWAAGDSFTFVIKASDAATEAAVAAGDAVISGEKVTIDYNSAEKTAFFDDITFKKAGDYSFTVTEEAGNLGGITYDGHELTVRVKVTDNGEGKLLAAITYGGRRTFDNIYEVLSAEVQLDGTKVLEGRPLEAEEFSFVLKDEAGNVLETVKNDEDGNFSFGVIDYTEAGTYKYTVSEAAGNLGGITYDETVYEVTVTVTDDLAGNLLTDVEISGNGEIGFRNSYEPKPALVQFSAAKKLVGRTLREGEFTFILADEDGNVIEKVKNDAKGGVTFSAVTYDEPGVYSYRIYERRLGQANVIFDRSVYDVTVKVTENFAEGILEAEIIITEEGERVSEMTFRNVYYDDPGEREDEPNPDTGAPGFGAMLLFGGVLMAIKKRR